MNFFKFVIPDELEIPLLKMVIIDFVSILKVEEKFLIDSKK